MFFTCRKTMFVIDKIGQYIGLIFMKVLLEPMIINFILTHIKIFTYVGILEQIIS